MKKIKLLIAEDHLLLRDGLVALLANTEFLEIAGQVGSGTDAVEFVRANPVDVVLMDIKMPGMNGIEATTAICNSFPGTKVIALSMFDDKSNITNMLRAGASSYLPKNVRREELLLAITEVSEGRAYFPKDISQKMLQAYMPAKDLPAMNAEFVFRADLSQREIQILGLIAKQFSNKEIADMLFLSTRTIDSHRRNILQKTGAKNTAGLVAFAFVSGIAEAGANDSSRRFQHL